MGYYFRAFCTTEEVPPLQQVLDWVRDRGVNLQVDSRDLGPDGKAAWRDEPVHLTYQEGKEPFEAEVNRNDAPDSLAGQEINEFLGMLQELKKGRKRDRIIDHLQRTKFVAALQIPVTGFPDAGFHAVDVFLAYFLVHCDALVQADGQGFYENGKLSIELAA